MPDIPYNMPTRQILAPYACMDEDSRGRLVHEANDSGNQFRPAFQRDRARITHSSYFRRLDSKTQVLAATRRKDHIRSRLTHSYEVAQLAEDAALELGINGHLARSIALAHDIGHPPFGHRGDEVLNDLMQNEGGFEHNAQAIRIVTELAQYKADPAFPGLNLTWETLEGIAKHNGPVAKPVWALAQFNARFDLELNSYASLEAQISALCDDIAYNNHDIEDGIDGGFFSLEDIKPLPLIGETAQRLTSDFPDADPRAIIANIRRDGINAMVQDVLTQTRSNLARFSIRTAHGIRAQRQPMAEFSAPMQHIIAAIRSFLNERMYHSPRIQEDLDRAEATIRALFAHFMGDVSRLPQEWQRKLKHPHAPGPARIVCDYIAGMTDRYAAKMQEKLVK